MNFARQEKGKNSPH